MRISDWSSDVCSSDLFQRSGCVVLAEPELYGRNLRSPAPYTARYRRTPSTVGFAQPELGNAEFSVSTRYPGRLFRWPGRRGSRRRSFGDGPGRYDGRNWRSEEHTSELQSLMRISYAVFCLK